MIKSINTKVDLVIDATSFSGLAEYGQIMIGDKGFEFFNGRDARKFIQIPWEEVNFIIASVLFKGKWIPRYAIETKRNGTFTFASKNPKTVLRAIRHHAKEEQMVRSQTFFAVLKRAFQQLWRMKTQ